MPALLEFQRAMQRAILGSAAEAPRAVGAWIGEDEEAAWRLALYRDTARTTLGNALAITYPAVLRLVGAEFFAGAAQAFIDAQRPQGGCLNDYGAGFAALLARFVAEHVTEAALDYLSDVATLEWAVNRALHAPDRPGLELGRLSALDETAMAALRFVPHPSVSLLILDYPADLIWRAVLDQDDAAMAAIDLGCGPACLLIERAGQSVLVQRLDAAAARFTQRLFAGEPLHAALETQAAETQRAVLADHLACGRMVDFEL
jgi:hypothetical protein